MRKTSRALLAALSLAGPTTARAADLDYDFLRGPDYDPPVAVTAIDWSGVYVGGHGGYSSAALGFQRSYQPLIIQQTHNSTAESDFGASNLLTSKPRRVGDVSFGGYAGYNVQFDDVVLGIEVDYTSFGRSGSSSDGISRFKTNSLGYLETVSLNGASSTKINDFGTIRARAGYAFGNLLPYVTGGFAIGRARIADGVFIEDSGYNATTYNANQALTVGKPAYVENFGYRAGTFSQTDPTTGVPYSTYVSKSKTKTVGGVALGGGLEYAITPSILLRAEYQYVLFNDFDGHRANLNTVRGGAAVKF
ncbi:porin family protein [Methylobacterium sp. WL30]|uniref:outer membrane protein n=1 Tax=unclassified Methylobacterium TaxID=2615210 RepID=UPI0011CCB3B9|nr:MULTISPECIES: outer membrane beta-barrel protein [unclassified Methylobacterium]MCJ2114357.1 outer membrane beta-barrel protein [Methylobacterium sp. E-025]TXN22140.1 porin family protein [Methylobacterium sp. WL93]TXN52570.1 porin family protein [Methylobacterium sp. WL119]TXN63926.1 porin family protein [Methylobacterium sp. WL30]